MDPNYKKSNKVPLAIICVCGVIMVALIIIAIIVTTSDKDNTDPYYVSNSSSHKEKEQDETTAMQEETDTTEESDVGAFGYIDAETEETSEESQAASTQEFLTVVNCSEYVTLRERDNVNGKEILKINFGQQVEFIGYANNGYYQVGYNGIYGYVLGSYLTDPAVQQSSVQKQIVNCKQSVTLRKTPSEKGDEICQVPLGAQITYFTSADNDFCFVSYNGSKGFVLAEYVR